MEPVRETLVIAEHDFAYAMRTVKAIVFLLIYALLTIAGGLVVVWLVSKAETSFQHFAAASNASPEQLAQAREATYVGLMTWFVGDAETAKYLTSIPVIVLFFFWASQVGLPLLIAVMSFDQVSGEVQNRSIRYVTLRARRGSLVAGKLLSNMVLLIGLTIVTNLIILGFADYMVKDLPLGTALLDLLRFWALLLPYGFAWLALMSWISSSVRSSFVALLIGLAILIGIKVFGGLITLTGTFWPPALYLRWIFPSAYQGFLLSHLVSQQLIGVAAFLGYGVFFTALAWITLKRRDV